MIVGGILTTIMIASVVVVFFFKFREISKQNDYIMKDLTNLKNYLLSRQKSGKNAGGSKDLVGKIYQELREFMCINASEIGSLKSKVTNIEEKVSRAVNFFRSPKGIGQFGESSLRSTLERSGYKLGENFFEQKAEGAKIPDCSVKIGDRLLHVDSKASNVDFKEGDLAAGKEFITKIKSHIRSLVSKKYNEMTNSFNHILLFLPTDGVMYHLSRLSPGIFQQVLKDHKIIIVSPMLLPAVIEIFREFPQNSQQNPIAKLARFASPKGQKIS